MILGFEQKTLRTIMPWTSCVICSEQKWIMHIVTLHFILNIHTVYILLIVKNPKFRGYFFYLYISLSNFYKLEADKKMINVFAYIMYETG